MEARSAEIAVLASATGSASDLLRRDRLALRKMRHADGQIPTTRTIVEGVEPETAGNGRP
jgi:hypothetical protein